MSDKDVRFIRRKGKIIPIRKRKRKKAGKQYGPLAGSISGGVGGVLLTRKFGGKGVSSYISSIALGSFAGTVAGSSIEKGIKGEGFSPKKDYRKKKGYERYGYASDLIGGAAIGGVVGHAFSKGISGAGKAALAKKSFSFKAVGREFKSALASSSRGFKWTGLGVLGLSLGTSAIRGYKEKSLNDFSIEEGKGFVLKKAGSIAGFVGAGALYFGAPKLRGLFRKRRKLNVITK